MQSKNNSQASCVRKVGNKALEFFSFLAPSFSLWWPRLCLLLPRLPHGAQTVFLFQELSSLFSHQAFSQLGVKSHKKRKVQASMEMFRCIYSGCKRPSVKCFRRSRGLDLEDLEVCIQLTVVNKASFVCLWESEPRSQREHGAVRNTVLHEDFFWHMCKQWAIGQGNEDCFTMY